MQLSLNPINPSTESEVLIEKLLRARTTAARARSYDVLLQSSIAQGSRGTDRKSTGPILYFIPRYHGS